MEDYQINHIHYLVEEALTNFNVSKHMVYVEPRNEVTYVTVFFKREHSNHPDVNHRVDIWCTGRATYEEIAGILLEAFEEEWEFSKENGFD